MLVCVCGGEEADAFCEAHDIIVFARYDGDLGSYRGDCPVLVTDQPMTREGYDKWKCHLFARGVELISTRWTDDEAILRLLRVMVERKGRRGGRQVFGFYRRNGEILANPAKMAVARKVIELRDAGLTYREIRDTDGVSHSGGKQLCTSTIRTICENRDLYEKG